MLVLIMVLIVLVIGFFFTIAGRKSRSFGTRRLALSVEVGGAVAASCRLTRTCKDSSAAKNSMGQEGSSRQALTSVVSSVVGRRDG